MKNMARLLAAVLAVGSMLCPLALKAQEAGGDEEGFEMEGPAGPPDEGEDWGPGRRGRGGDGADWERRGMRQGKEFKQKMKKRMGAILKDPEVRKIMKQKKESHQKAKKLVQGYRSEKDAAKKKALEEELKKVLGEAFDADLAAHEMRLKKMSEEISRLKKRITKRRGMKDKLVEKKIGELTGDEEGWDW